MEKRQLLWKTKGMNKDLSVSAFNPEFAFENMNLRLSTNEHNTLMSWVNERGTEKIDIVKEGETATPLNIEGTPVGTAVIDHQLIVFTHNEVVEDNITIYTDKIYLLKKYQSNNFVGKVLYSGDLNLRESNPLETLVSYEMDTVEKVYWVDGRNQPRVINIKGNVKEGIDTQFDFVPALGLNESISVTKSAATGGGLFAPGVIQYGFTYVNKYGQESNMAMVSSLQYLSHVDRGASPEEKVTDSFIIQIDNVDQNFDYVRLYSIHRSSLNGVPQVKMLEEIEISPGAMVESYIYSDDPFNNQFTVTLPVALREEDPIKVEGANISNGTYDVTFTPTEGNLEGYPIQRDYAALDFYYYSDNSATLHYIMSFQQLMYNLVTDVQHPGYAEYVDVENYYAQTQIDSVIKGLLLMGIVTSSTPRIALKADDTDTLLEDDILDKYLVYHFRTKKWYICDNAATETARGYTEISYQDNGTTGSSVDPQSLLYIGGREITALTMAEKDKTLFLGNIEEKNSDVTAIQDFFSSRNTNLSFTRDVSVKSVMRDKEYPNDKRGFYSYCPQLENNRRQITTFKGGETYRFGFQLQKETGEWTEPIYLKDVENTIYPNSKVYSEYTALPFARGIIPVLLTDPITHERNIDLTEYKKIRPLVVYPTISDRSILCQGVLNPTVFNVEDRNQKLPYAQASWYFRPYMVNKEESPIGTAGSYTHQKSRDLRFVHYDTLPSTLSSNSYDGTNQEVQGASIVYKTVFNDAAPGINANTQFFVDQSIVTLNSPDIDFDTDVQNYGTDGLKLRIVGAVPITGNASAHKIEISSSMTSLGLKKDGDGAHFGKGELDDNTIYNNVDIEAGNRLISDFIWEDARFDENSSADDPATYNNTAKFIVYPWQRTGPLNNDFRSQEKASSWLKKKKESNLLYSINTEYLVNRHIPNIDYGNKISAQLHLTENDFISNIRLQKQKSTSSDINYYPNVDKALYNENGYYIGFYQSGQDPFYEMTFTKKSTLPISMRYKSTSHAVITLEDSDNLNHDIYLMPYGQIVDYDAGGQVISTRNIGKYVNGSGTTFWGDTGMTFNQSYVNMSFMFPKYQGQSNIYPRHNWLWLGELYKDPVNRFGGTGRDAIRANNWVVGGDAIDIPDATNQSDVLVELRWTEGDTYFQRYDCLKTYAFSPEDTNQLVEILSFMVETHVNLDGRYDKNRGQQVSYAMNPQNFNLLNPVYSQQDNFFSYKKADIETQNKKYPNQIAYSLTKTSGADVDAWTNVNLGSVLELDGDKGPITKLARLDDKLIAFQDSGISQILYNESVQVESTAGAPIEIANSGKVQGARYISGTVGCSNKWSIAQTPSGLYFMDSNDKSIYLLGDRLKNITQIGGFNTWAKNNISTYKEEDGEPLSAGAFKAFYDRLNQEVLFINEEKALAWSERIGAFTSFYDYGNAPYFINLDDEGYWLNTVQDVNSNSTDYKLWKHQGGNYCEFFGVNKEYYTTLIGNAQPQADKIFTNLEFRACVDRVSGEQDDNQNLPFDSIKAWNEYQSGITTLKSRNAYSPHRHYEGGYSALLRKFRIWRCDIPRDNDTTGNRTARPMDRMRNPWLYLKLVKEAASTGSTLSRAEIHDIVMDYFV